MFLVIVGNFSFFETELLLTAVASKPPQRQKPSVVINYLFQYISIFCINDYTR